MRAAPRILLLALALCLLGALSASAADITANGISWQAKKASAVLTIAGDGELITLNFGPGEAPFLPVSGLTDGGYTWELVYNAPARNRGLDAESVRGEALSGHVTVLDGLFVIDRPETAATKDQVILDDLIVEFSACIGNDCSNGESFGFDTLRLKENNLRLHFDDTSTTASFPQNDWRLVANDSTNGGDNYLAIEDSTAGRQPFRVDAGAPANSLRVDSAGDVGLGTSNPIVDLHIVSGNTPTVRLEQNGSSGFTPQTYDLAANEANFFIRDVTNGSKLFFKAKPGAPTSSIFVAADGDIGLGTESPEDPLHIRESENATVRLENATDAVEWFLRNDSASDGLLISKQGSGGAEIKIDALGDVNGPTFVVDGSVSATNVMFSSTRDKKADFESVDTADVLDRLGSLDLQTWRYKTEDASVRHMGPIAEDFAAAFELGNDEKAITVTDVNGVALAAIQALYEKVQNLEAQNDALQLQNQELSERLSEVENR